MIVEQSIVQIIVSALKKKSFNLSLCNNNKFHKNKRKKFYSTIAEQ